MADPPVIVWFRRDLRLADNPALAAAADTGRPVLPVYLHAPDEDGDWPMGGAQRVYVHAALEALSHRLESVGFRLIVRSAGKTLDALEQLIEQTGAGAVYWNRRYEPAMIERDSAIKTSLRNRGVEVESFNGALLFEPHEIATQAGDPYKVFSPFWRACNKMPTPAPPLAPPKRGELKPPADWPSGESIDGLKLMPDHAWGKRVASHWKVGEEPAVAQLGAFCRDKIFTYKEDRNRPDLDATTMLSPALAVGTISPRQCYHAGAVRYDDAPDKTGKKSVDHFLSELGWREFSYHVLYHFPTTPTKNLNPRFNEFPWIDMRQGRHWLEDWQRGRTGYPIVDAGMRQLWQTGWMHNRVRMIVASFLTKDLRIHWLEGARWFWDTLVDADLANNTQGWQWAAGCGTDAQPYFRIFNPYLQGKKFDPDGSYVRRWVPELADLPAGDIHDPPPLAKPSDYPDPMVDHRRARDEALAAYDRVKG